MFPSCIDKMTKDRPSSKIEVIALHTVAAKTH